MKRRDLSVAHPFNSQNSYVGPCINVYAEKIDGAGVTPAKAQAALS